MSNLRPLFTISLQGSFPRVGARPRPHGCLRAAAEPQEGVCLSVPTIPKRSFQTKALLGDAGLVPPFLQNGGFAASAVEEGIVGNSWQ